MTDSRMETFYCGDGTVLYKTCIGCIADTPAETWRLFNNARQAAVPRERATFLLDYYNRHGDLAGTIFLDAFGYAAITNEPVLTEAQYAKIDRDYWRKAQKEYRASQKQVA